MSSNEAQTSSSGLSTQRVSAFECIICMDVLINPRVLPCGHSYCSSPKTCLSNLLKMKTPPQCASCNHKLPANISEDDVPKNYALSSAIEETQASGGEDSKCQIHQKDQEFYCRTCGTLICSSCWKIDHKDKNRHEVEPFSCTLEPYSDIQNTIAQCRQETENLSEMLIKQVEKCSELLEEIHTTEEVLRKLLCSNNPSTMNKQAEVLRTQISAAQMKLSDVEKLLIVSFEQPIEHIRSKLTDVISGDGSIFRKTLAEWEDIPEVPKIEKIPVDLDGFSISCFVTDIDRKNLFAYLHADPIMSSQHRVQRYEMEGGAFIFRSEAPIHCSCSNGFFGFFKSESIFCPCFNGLYKSCGMCLANNRLVILQPSHLLKLHFLDKQTLEKIETKTFKFPVYPFNTHRDIFRIAGYADVLIVLRNSEHKFWPRRNRVHELAVLRGEHLKSLGEPIWESTAFHSYKLCNNRTIILHNRYKICLIDFDEEQITRTRCITIKHCDDLHRVALKLLPMPTLLKGYLFVDGLFGGSSTIKSVKIDIDSVEDGMMLSANTVPGFGKTEYLLRSSSAQAVVYSEEGSEWQLVL